MSPAENVFFAALAKVDPADRAAYLNEACGTDADLRRQVDRLLAAYPQVGSFLQEDPAAHPSTLVGVQLEGQEVRGGATIDGPVTEGPGTVIGPYKLLQQIGEGGMGTVYMAEQSQPVQRKVALKIIKHGVDGRQVIARFEAERQALAMMDHVNIARVFDGGATENGRPYFVMELVHGVPITPYCDDNRLTPRERLELFVPVCQAIQHAHQKGIIHRDIKPSNVMVTLYDGKPVPKVIDFGVAKATEQKLTERTLFTQYGTMVGTLEYMSPEQAEMSALGVDTRSDIYSLGVLLYELLTGNTPLTHKRMKEAAYAEILRMIKEVEPPRPSTRLSDSGAALASISANRHTEPAKLTKLMRGELDWIVMKTLEKDRNRRYETAKDFAADVQRYLNDEPVQACPPSAGYRLRKFVRRNKGPVLAASLVLLVLVGGIIGTTLGMMRATDAQAHAVYEAKQKDEARTDAEAKKTQAESNEKKAKKLAGELALVVATEKEARELATQSEKEARWNVYVARLFPMQAAWQERNFGQLERLLKDSVPKPGEPDFRGWEWYYFQDQVRQASTTLPGSWSFAAWCRKTGRIAAVRIDSEIDIWDKDQKKVECTLPRPPQLQQDWLHKLVWSPDGGRLACAWGDETGTIVLWDVAAVRILHQVDVKGLRALAWSKDGERLATGHQDGLIKIWDARTGRLLKELSATSGNPILPVLFVWGLAWHPDGKRLAATGRFGFCQVWDTDTGNLLFTRAQSPSGTPLTAVDWSPDGKKLAAGSVPIMFVYDEQGRELFSMKAKADTSELEWSPDGKYLLSGHNDHAVKVWDGATGEELQSWRLHDAPIFSVAWSPDGTKVLSASQEVRISRALVQDNTKFTQKSVASKPLTRVAWSPDGRWLASGSVRGKILLCDANTGQINPAWKEVLANQRVSVAWSPDSNRLALLDYDTNAYVSDRDTANTLRVLPLETPKEGGNWNLAWSPNGKWLSIANGFGANSVWSTESWRSEGLLGDAQTQHLDLSWSPDSKYLATGDYGGIGVWDVMQRSRVFHALCGTVEGSTAWSPDGQLIAGGTLEGRIPIVRFADGKVVHTAQGHTAHVSGAYWSPDGRRLASSSFDGTIKIWDAATGDHLVTLPSDDVQITSLTWSPDGRRLACGCSDGSLRIWGSPDMEGSAKGATHLETGVLAVATNPKAEIKEASAGPFFTFAQAGRPERGWATLANAVAMASAGDTIEIRDDGPFEMAPIDVGKKALTIRAGQGAWPVLRLARRHFGEQALLTSLGPLVLEGVELQRLGSAEDAVQGWTLVAHGGLRMAHSRLVQSEPGSATSISGPGSSNEIVNSQLFAAWANVGIWAGHASEMDLLVRNSILAGGAGVGLNVPKKPAKTTIRFLQNTLAVDSPLHLGFWGAADWIDWIEKGNEPPPVLLEFSGNVLGGQEVGRMIWREETGVRTAERAKTGLKGLMAWKEEKNLYPLQPFVVSYQGSDPASVTVLEKYEDWRKFWGLTTSPSLQGEPVFERGDMRNKDPKETLPAGFRLAKGSAGKGAGADGKDLGADVDLVGPGPAYDRWRQTPEYQKWRADSEKFLTGR